ncbi:MAG: hypothetical protein NPMRTH4_1350002 [Nitrosopumilales archaeon]|nr:MAG: hypothetical protein NPMRTH4_1350002 [Nitrosopumilales archaeon]
MVDGYLIKYWIFILIILSIFSVAQEATAIEIIAIPLEDLFGPNDWIQIDVDIDGYFGGVVNWNATKPDNSILSGEFSSLKGSHKTHFISRDAFDNQFGTWTINYFYGETNKTVTAEVEPLVVQLSLDKPSYQFGDEGTAYFITNYFEPIAANAEFYRIEIHDESGEPALQTDYVLIKAYQETTIYKFSPDKLLKYNPPGEYYVNIQYFNTITEIPFSIGSDSVDVLIFVGVEKVLYLPGEIININMVVTEILGTDGTLRILSPSGQLTTKIIPINSASTKVSLDDVPTNLPGSYQIIFEYGGNSATAYFSVPSDETPASSDIDISLSLNKKQYRPGEVILANFETNQIIEGKISFWFEDPVGNSGPKISYNNPLAGEFSIQHVLSPTMVNGPWKMYIDYSGLRTFGIFFVEGEPVEGAIISGQGYEGPEVSLILDNTNTDFIQVVDVAVDSQNNLYVLDSGDLKIKKFDSNGNLIMSWGSIGSGDQKLENPSGIFVDAKNVHVADKGNGRIVTYDMDGNFLGFWGTSEIDSQSLRNPDDIVLDSFGTFYVSDSGWNKILKFDEFGKFVGEIKSLQTAAAKFSGSNSIVSDQNMLFILITKDNRILQFSNEGNFVKSFGTTGEDDGKFLNPNSLAIDKNGNLLVADSGNHRVQVLDQNGKFLTKWGTFGTGYAQFLKISGIAVDSQGSVFTADSQANRILKFTYEQIELFIPDWVRNNAGWWASDQINDDDFALGIQFMIEEKIIVIPDLGQSEEVLAQQIPEWIKNNARWWSERQISDEAFANGIEYMVINGIILI